MTAPTPVRGRLVMHGVIAGMVLAVAASFCLWQGFSYNPINPGHIPTSTASCVGGVSASAAQYTAGATITITIDGVPHTKQTGTSGTLTVPNPNTAIPHTYTVTITAPDWPLYSSIGEIPSCSTTTTATASTTSPTTSSPSTVPPPTSTSPTSTAPSSTTAPSTQPPASTSTPTNATAPPTSADAPPSTDATAPTTVGTQTTNAPTPTTAPHTPVTAPASGLPATR